MSHDARRAARIRSALASSKLAHDMILNCLAAAFIVDLDSVGYTLLVRPGRHTRCPAVATTGAQCPRTARQCVRGRCARPSARPARKLAALAWTPAL